MSLEIDIDRVSAVLLADGWHDVADVSFMVDAYEYLDFGHAGGHDYPPGKAMLLHNGGAGFAFMEPGGQWIYGPVSSILAVRTDSQEKAEAKWAEYQARKEAEYE